MSTIPVLATVSTRRQADVMIIALRQAGIGFQKISAVFPRQTTPIAVACWMHFRQRLSLSIGRMRVLAVGQLLAGGATAAPESGISSLIEKYHFDHAAACAVERSLKHGQILLCVHAESGEDTSVAWHIFKHYAANLIVMGKAEPVRAPLAAQAPTSMLVPA